MSAFIEKLLNFKVIILGSLALIALEVQYLHSLNPRANYVGLLMFTVLPLAMALGQLERAWWQYRGHSTTHVCRKLGRFPIQGICIMSIPLLLGVGGMKLSVDMYRMHFALSSTADMFICFFNVTLAVILVSLRWHFILYFRYWAGSEVEAISELTLRGVDPKIIAQIMKYYRVEGFVVTDTPVPKAAMI